MGAIICNVCGTIVDVTYYTPNTNGVCPSCVDKSKPAPSGRPLFEDDKYAHNGAGCYDSDFGW